MNTPTAWDLLPFSFSDPIDSIENAIVSEIDRRVREKLAQSSTYNSLEEYEVLAKARVFNEVLRSVAFEVRKELADRCSKMALDSFLL